MKTDDAVYVPQPDAQEQPGSYGPGGRIVVAILLTLALVMFGVFAWVVDLGILRGAGGH